MSFTVVCDACGSRFALTDDLYERKFKDRLVTVRCKHCNANINVDGVELASGPQHEIPVAGTPLEDGASDAPLDLTPTVPLASASNEWTVSFSYEDDRELDRDGVAKALASGDINADTLVWRDGMEEWLPIARVDGLADLVQQDTTGGFLGTGMQLDTGAGSAKLKKPAPPPHPAKRRSKPPQPAQRQPQAAGDAAKASPPPPRGASLGGIDKGKTAGKARALSPGTLFVGDKPAAARKPEPAKPKLPTAPKAPVPAWKANAPEAPPSSEEEPPSSGTPALRDLMAVREYSEPAKPNREDPFAPSTDPGALLAPPAFDLTPPSIDVESPAPAPAVEEESIEVELDSKPPPSPDVARAAPAAGSGSGRRVAGFLLVGAAAAFCVWWFGFKSPTAKPTADTAASAPVDTPTPAAASEAVVQKTPEPEPTESAEPETSAAAAKPEPEPAAPSPAKTVAAEPAKRVHTVAEKTHTTDTHPSAPAPEKEAKPEPEPAAATAAPTATATAGPFNKSAAIAALGAAAGAASGCRKEGDPSGMARVTITFAPSGRVTTARVSGPPFAGTPTGGCIAARMRGARVPPFSGPFVTVTKTIVIH